MTGYSAEVVADSISPDGVRLTTILTRYPRFIHAEMLRHRVFSHSVASSRAIPPEVLVQQVREEPFVPSFNYRVKGMGVGEPLSKASQARAEKRWRFAAEAAAIAAEDLIKLDVDKCRVNRLLEPYLFVTDLITATEWDNFFALRDHPDAQPEFQVIARMMREVMGDSTPRRIKTWHLPLVADQEINDDLGYVEGESLGLYGQDREDVIKNWAYISAGRCARVSYERQYEEESRERSIERAKRLINSGHMSPFEHVARPMHEDDIWGDVDGAWVAGFRPGMDGVESVYCGNLRGWVQMRKEISNEDDFSKIHPERQETRA